MVKFFRKLTLPLVTEALQRSPRLQQFQFSPWPLGFKQSGPSELDSVISFVYVRHSGHRRGESCPLMKLACRSCVGLASGAIKLPKTRHKLVIMRGRLHETLMPWKYTWWHWGIGQEDAHLHMSKHGHRFINMLPAMQICVMSALHARNASPSAKRRYFRKQAQRSEFTLGGMKH